MPSSPVRNLHVPLPDHLHARLKQEAVRSGRAATTLAREAIERWLIQREQDALDKAIEQYAGRNAGSAADLDADLGRAGLDSLTDPEAKP